MTGEPCILVNRTSSPLEFVADSRHYKLLPGDNVGLNTGHAPFAMAQNPLMGSENFHSLEFQSLVGIKGVTDCAPIDEDELLVSYDKVERFNREEAGLAKVKTVKKPRPVRSAESSSGAGQRSFAVAST